MNRNVKEERYRTNNFDNPGKKDFIRVTATYFFVIDRLLLVSEYYEVLYSILVYQYFFSMLRSYANKYMVLKENIWINYESFMRVLQK